MGVADLLICEDWLDRLRLFAKLIGDPVYLDHWTLDGRCELSFLQSSRSFWDFKLFYPVFF
jgi:hypothetical protein